MSYFYTMIVRRYQEGDAPKISALMYRCFVRQSAYEIRSHAADYYAWKYAPNPWGKPVVWVAEYADQIVGMMAVVPKSLWINGETWLCGESGDTFMDPAAKGKHVFLDMASHVFEDCKQAGMQVIYGTPNRVSYDVVTKLFGYEELFHYRSLVRPLRFGSLIRMKLKNRWLSCLIGWSVAGVHHMVYWPKVKSASFMLESIAKPDERFDRLWETMHFQIGCSVIKNRDYVQWRFVDSPEDFRVMLVKRGDEPVGYVTFKFTPMQGLLCGHVVDLTVDIPESEWPVLWACVLTELKKQNADFVNTWMVLNHPRTRQMKQFGFIMRKKPFWIVMRGEQRKLKELPDVKDPLKWMFSQADTDNI